MSKPTQPDACEQCDAAVADPMGLIFCAEHRTERKPPYSMILCTGCGFNVERSEIREHDYDARIAEDTCLRCFRCQTTPALRESYRRGFNAGLDAMKEAVIHAAEKSNLRKRPES